jgi:hypothetical protein
MRFRGFKFSVKSLLVLMLLVASVCLGWRVLGQHWRGGDDSVQKAVARRDWPYRDLVSLCVVIRAKSALVHRIYRIAPPHPA